MKTNLQNRHLRFELLLSLLTSLPPPLPPPPRRSTHSCSEREDKKVNYPSNLGSLLSYVAATWTGQKRGIIGKATLPSTPFLSSSTEEMVESILIEKKRMWKEEEGGGILEDLRNVERESIRLFASQREFCLTRGTQRNTSCAAVSFRGTRQFCRGASRRNARIPIEENGVEEEEGEGGIIASSTCTCRACV